MSYPYPNPNAPPYPNPNAPPYPPADGMGKYKKLNTCSLYGIAAGLLGVSLKLMHCVRFKEHGIHF